MRVELYSGVFPNTNCYPALSLVTTFKEYRINGVFWAFGRDVPYHRPPLIQEYFVRHIHLLSGRQYRDYQGSNTRLFSRTSDKHLIYARSPIDEDHYLLIAIVDPNAHETAANMNFMHQLYDICKAHFG